MTISNFVENHLWFLIYCEHRLLFTVNKSNFIDNHGDVEGGKDDGGTAYVTKGDG